MLQLFNSASAKLEGLRAEGGGGCCLGLIIQIHIQD